MCKNWQKKENTELDGIVRVMKNKKVSKRIQTMIVEIIKSKDNKISKLENKLSIVESLPNNDFVFIVSFDDNWPYIKWKSKKLKEFSDEEIIWKTDIMSVQIQSYIVKAIGKMEETVYSDKIIELWWKKYFVKFIYSIKNNLLDVYLEEQRLLKHNIVDSLQTMLLTAHERDPETWKHLKRISIFSVIIAQRLLKNWHYKDILINGFIEAKISSQNA